MTLFDVIKTVDDIKPNAFLNNTKTAWINEVEGLVQTEVLLLASSSIISYNFDSDSNTQLLVKPPHDKIYWTYLSAMIDFANGEYNKYQNSMQLFNTYFGEYMRWYALNYHPADGKAITSGYYLSAYSIAVKHGYSGTEEEWIMSLKGEPGTPGNDGDPGKDGADGKDGKDGENGADGDDGFSPVVYVEDIVGGHKVTIIDAEHPQGQSFSVLNGEGTSEQRVAELISSHNSSESAHPTKADLVDGKVPASQLPSYVDDVIEYDSISLFPTQGESGKIYVDIDTNKTYRWSGSGYMELSPSIALGETSSTAYRGDRGKEAYDHSIASGNPHSTSFADLQSKPTTIEGYGITDLAHETWQFTLSDGSTVSKEVVLYSGGAS